MKIFVMANSSWAQRMKDRIPNVTLCGDFSARDPDVLVLDLDVSDIDDRVKECRFKYPRKPIVAVGHAPSKIVMRHLFTDLHVDEVMDKTESPDKLINGLSSILYRKERRERLGY